MQRDALCIGGFGSLLAGIALIDKGERHILAYDILYRLCQTADFLPIADIRGRDVERQQMAERIDRHMDLGATLALGAIIARTGAAFGR